MRETIHVRHGRCPKLHHKYLVEIDCPDGERMTLSGIAIVVRALSEHLHEKLLGSLEFKPLSEGVEDESGGE